MKKRMLGASVLLPRALLLPHSAVSTKLPKPLRQTAYYRVLYENAIARKAFPLIEAIDDALWSVFLREAARRRSNIWCKCR